MRLEGWGPYQGRDHAPLLGGSIDPLSVDGLGRPKSVSGSRETNLTVRQAHAHSRWDTDAIFAAESDCGAIRDRLGVGCGCVEHHTCSASESFKHSDAVSVQPGLPECPEIIH